MATWAETYFDHYEKNLGKAQRRDVFDILDVDGKVQILAYKNVFEKTITFCSIGLSGFSERVGTTAELMVVVDEGWEYIPNLLAQTVSYIITEPMAVGWGFVVSGESKLNPEFHKKYKKEALYFTHPMGLPNEFYSVVKKDSNIAGEIYMGIPISKREMNLFSEVGADKFESEMQSKGVDPFEVGRPSII